MYLVDVGTAGFNNIYYISQDLPTPLTSEHGSHKNLSVLCA